MDARYYTNKLLDLLEQGILSWEDIARECLSYMSEDDVKDMAISNDLIDEEEEDADFDEVDSESAFEDLY